MLLHIIWTQKWTLGQLSKKENQSLMVQLHLPLLPLWLIRLMKRAFRCLKKYLGLLSWVTRNVKHWSAEHICQRCLSSDPMRLDWGNGRAKLAKIWRDGMLNTGKTELVVKSPKMLSEYLRGGVRVMEQVPLGRNKVHGIWAQPDSSSAAHRGANAGLNRPHWEAGCWWCLARPRAEGLVHYKMPSTW